MTSQRGQRQPYRVLTEFPAREGRAEINGRDSSASLSEIDHQARKAAHRGATAHVIYLMADGQALLIYTYTPENVQAADDDPELVRIFLETDIIRWYQKQGVQPQEVKMPRSGKKLVVSAVTAAAPATKEATTHKETSSWTVAMARARKQEDGKLVGVHRNTLVAMEKAGLCQRMEGKRGYYLTEKARTANEAAPETETPVPADEEMAPEGVMAADEQIVDELNQWMVEHGWTQPKASFQSRFFFKFIAQRLRTQEPMESAAADGDMTDEELWNSPLGHRLRVYADKLLLAEEERIRAFHKRQVDAVMSAGVSRGRSLIHPLGDPSPMGAEPDEVQRPDIDPWADWQSPEVVGMREAVTAAGNSQKAAQEAAKAYIAGLQGDDRPTAEEPTHTQCSGGAAIDHDETGVCDHASGDTPTDGDKEPPTPMDVAGGLSYLLTGHVASDRGPFAVHGADGFHDEPYVILPLHAMAKVLSEIPKERW
ncbi:hypothetical protein [Streptomyces sp. NPDC018055]|uniref:hypothetical protein n=1 Tax=Streptomyces sp. NPDC018055 TaxID=3365038 RepID=UPI0037AE6815